MKKITITALLLVLLSPSLALAHGGAWRGPGGGTRNPGDISPGAAPGPKTWTTTWRLSRERILKLRELQEERQRARTKGETARFFGESGEGNQSGEDTSEAWDAIVSALLTAARDKHPDVSTGAIIALGKAADRRSLPLLMDMAADEKLNNTVNESATLALGMMAEGGTEVRRFLEKILIDSNRRRRTRAMAGIALGFFGDTGALPALMGQSRAREKSREVPTGAILGIGLLREEMVIPDLSRLLSGPLPLREKDDFIRAYYAAALGKIGSRAALPALRDALRDREVQVRRQAVLSIASLAKPTDADLVKELTRLLARDKDQGVRAFAAIALGEIGAADAVGALRYAYQNGSPIVVPHAALGLALLVRAGIPEVISERIVGLLRKDFAMTGNLNMRGALAISMGIMRDQQSIPGLLKLLDSKAAPMVRGHAAVALGVMGAEDAAPALRRVLEENFTAPALKREAALALALLGDRGATKLLLGLVKDGSSEYVKGSAAVALGRLATLETAKILMEIVGDPNQSATTRAFSAVALGMVIDRRPFPIITEIGEHLNHTMALEAVKEVLTLL